MQSVRFRHLFFRIPGLRVPLFFPTGYRLSRRAGTTGYGYWLPATGYWLPATGYRLLATGYWLPARSRANEHLCRLKFPPTRARLGEGEQMALAVQQGGLAAEGGFGQVDEVAVSQARQL